MYQNTQFKLNSVPLLQTVLTVISYTKTSGSLISVESFPLHIFISWT